ncbi:hypothetical protein Purlil1_4691 [Purpureocillium lilacinum]|uniref:Indoleamine 2,3-dioxygenase family protein n=1 Tax=Purpureocillium lilacinum TaxID=33203 RepID=A0ABR0C553_PURLI|nr:hypothetical protein Purlil1_4691 [Purpureocillium lilacinum]
MGSNGPSAPCEVVNGGCPEDVLLHPFTVSATRGFLTLTDPLVDLPEEFQALESVLQQMPIRTASGKPGLIAEGRLAAVVDSELPDLTAQVDLYRDDLRVICALFRDYCFLASGYLLEPCHRRFMKSQEYGVGRPSLPKQIARPFVRCSEIAGFKPFLEFASYVLLNYRLDDPAKGMDFSNLRLVRAYEHGLDPSSSESGFILVHLSMVKLSGPLVHSTLKAFEAASKATTPLGTIEERTLLNEALSSMVQAVSNLNVLMKSIYERSKPSEYNNFRTFMFGIASESMFPNGVIYEGYNNDEPVFFRGETGANDAMIPLLDNFLQIPMPDTPLTEILHEFSEYRSCKHKAFLIFVKERSLELDIKKFALGSVAIADCEEMSDLVRESRSLWLQVLNQVREFRWRHWCLVKEYILKRSSHPTATGGSPIVTWLPNQLDAVLEDMVQVDATSREHDPRGLGKKSIAPIGDSVWRVNPHAGHAAANVVAESSKHMRDMKWGNRLALTPMAVVSSLTALLPKQAKLPPPFLWQCLRTSGQLSESCMRTLSREPVTLIVSILHVSHGCGVRATATPAVPLGHSTSGHSISNFTQLHGSFGALLRGSFS